MKKIVTYVFLAVEAALFCTFLTMDIMGKPGSNYVKFAAIALVGAFSFFAGKEKDSYLLGRLAVVKSYRGKKIGSKMIEEAEKAVKEQGGKNICLHSQCRAKDFYAKCGYMPFGEEDEEEGCPHIWMKKSL